MVTYVYRVSHAVMCVTRDRCVASRAPYRVTVSPLEPFFFFFF